MFVNMRIINPNYCSLLFSRATKIIIRCCSNSGEKSTDFPVRYIPKKSLKLNKRNDSDSTLVPKESENYEARRFRNANSLNVEFSNGGERFRDGLYLDENSADNDFKPGIVLITLFLGLTVFFFIFTV